LTPELLQLLPGSSVFLNKHDTKHRQDHRNRKKSQQYQPIGPFACYHACQTVGRARSSIVKKIGSALLENDPDFVNTASWRTSGSTTEHLENLDDVLRGRHGDRIGAPR
jgi:hypothetical protein